jgi:hypothetical protein
MPFRNVKLILPFSRPLARETPALALCVLLTVLSGRAAAANHPFWRPVILTGDQLGCLAGTPVERIALSGCNETCAPIPWQLDERDAGGRLALTEGTEPNPDDPPGVVDANDELLWMLDDGGRPMRPAERPRSFECGLEIALRSANSPPVYAYAFVLPEPAPRSPRSYVRHDARRDTLAGQRVALGFGAPTPRHLALLEADGSESPNLLDRLKIRVSTRFLGLIPVGRNEGHLGAEQVAHRSGPIRLVRRQRLWVYVGFGIRSQLFASDTFVYRNFAELPVSFRLNYPPTHFFWPIEVNAILDFRDLRGWELLVPGPDEPLRVGTIAPDRIERINETTGDWFVLRRTDVTLVERLHLGSSLASVRARLSYAETDDEREPEDVPGERPAVGFRLTDWNDVGNGQHSFTSVSYALPPGYDVRAFLEEEAKEVEVTVRGVK